MKRLSRVLSLCLIILMISNTFVFGQINIDGNIKGALLGDLETGEIIYEYNIDEQVAIASITKLMTYLVMMDQVKAEKISLEDDVLISGHAAATEGSRFGLQAGETIKLSTLIKGMLIVSGNDCAVAIAEHVGGTVDNFVKMMNEKASELGLLSASFINSNGLPLNDEETGQNHMSISDMYKLTRHILTEYPEILEVTKQEALVIPERNYNKEATNPVLGIVPGVDGLKTGYTDKAGICLVSTMAVTDSGEDFRLIGIIMGAQTHDDRINKTKELLEYGKNNFNYQIITETSNSLETVYITNSKQGKVDVYPASDFSKLVKNDDVVRTVVSYNESVSAPLKSGDKIGIVTIYVNDEEVGKVDAVVNQNVEKANIFVQIFRFIKNLFN